MIIPILTYGAEIWGHSVHHSIENVQVKYCKFVIGLSSSASRAAALGECGFVNIKVECTLKLVKYWSKTIQVGK